MQGEHAESCCRKYSTNVGQFLSAISSVHGRVKSPPSLFQRWQPRTWGKGVARFLATVYEEEEALYTYVPTYPHVALLLPHPPTPVLNKKALPGWTGEAGGGIIYGKES